VTAGKPVASSTTALEARANASARLWVANPDTDTVPVIDTATNARVAETVFGSSSRSVAVAADGPVWVTNKGSSTIGIVNAGTLALAAGQRVAIPIEFQEFGGGAVLQLSWQRPGGAWAQVPPAQLYPAAVAPVPVNLAPSSTLATSHVAAWDTLAAVNNNVTPANSADRSTGACGATDWVDFSWSTAKTLSAFEVCWWIDGAGIGTPTFALVECWNGTAWVSLGSPALALNTFNRLNFAPVTATSIRVSMRSVLATGIVEARVFGN
jgi:YVTN family beta-propeller protein